MKYYIKRISLQTGRIEYYKNKTVAAWVFNKNYCWRFSKQGAKNIIKRYEEFEKRRLNNQQYFYDIEPVEDVKQ
jgi:hypothetical protein